MVWQLGKRWDAEGNLARFGDVFHAPVGNCTPRERQGEVWPFRSHEFPLRREAIVSVGFGQARRPTQVPHDWALSGSRPVKVRFRRRCPPPVGASEAMDRRHAVDSDTESVVSAGRRFHHSFEDALEMDFGGDPGG